MSDSAPATRPPATRGDIGAMLAAVPESLAAGVGEPVTVLRHVPSLSRELMSAALALFDPEVFHPERGSADLTPGWLRTHVDTAVCCMGLCAVEAAAADRRDHPPSPGTFWADWDATAQRHLAAMLAAEGVAVPA